MIGIFAGLVIAAITGITQAGQREVATYNLNKLNAAVTAYNNANAELVVSSTLGIGDETAVFALLQARNEANPVPGTPYLEAHIPFVGTSSNERHRAVWNGRYFQLLPIGIDGTGIDLEAIGK